MWDVFSQIRSFKKNYQLTKKRSECDQRIELAHPLVGACEVKTDFFNKEGE